MQEIGMTYTCPRLVRLDSNFKYKYADSTGIVSEDYNKLYKDERYSSNEDNPLNRSYYDNVNSIMEANDIRITKNGDSYEIFNGRHRLLYLLNNGSRIDIPCYVTMGFEDREVNLVLLELKNKYQTVFHKNNIFNDELDIIITIEDKLYNIKNKEELLDFDKNKYKYYVGIINQFRYSAKLSMAYEKKLIELTSSKGLSFLKSNYTDILEYFPDLNSNILYDVYSGLQLIYAKNIVFKEKKDIIDILLDEYDRVVEKIKQILEKEENKRR